MKKNIKKTLVVVALVLLLTCLASTFTACSILDSYYSAKVQALSNELSLLFLGNSIEDWNVFAIDPEGSYGYEKYGEYSWRSYSALSQQDADELYDLFKLCDSELHKIKLSRLKGSDAVSYRYMESVIDQYLSYYGSPYVLDFNLIGSSIINSEGGYVASFADTVDNYAFRDKDDVDNLLALTKSTKDAFPSYLEYVDDRDLKGYSLWDVTVTNMQNYLAEILSQGDDYYLYKLIRNKINGAHFLNVVQKNNYISKYVTAIRDCFMVGVKVLHDGLEDYKGVYPDAAVSYLTAYGEIGEAYYKWRFSSITGIKNAKIEDSYEQIRLAVVNAQKNAQAVLTEINALEETNPQVYNEFYDYVEEKKAPLGLSEPEDIIAYMQTVADSIVPSLATQPEISFKYMDDTVASISNSLAYYLKSPADQSGTGESITINSHSLGDRPATLFDTIAHEGYPGHLYAYVNAKENGADLFSLINDNTTFAEGWAMYASIAVLNYTAEHTDSLALKQYCKFKTNYLVFSYADNALMDLLYNYFGYTEGILSEGDDFSDMFAVLRENPAVYIAYGYGVTVLTDVHDKARAALGDKYNEVEFNRTLLSEGAGPTVTRTYELTEKYIKSNK